MNRREFLGHSVAAGGAAWTAAPDNCLPTDALGGSGEGQKPGSSFRDRWIRPGKEDKRAIWGIHGGIQAALWPASVEGPGDGGPRGLIRIGYPIIDGGKSIGLVNFIAVEPFVKGRRGFSELERSDTDGRPGRMFHSDETRKPGDMPDPGSLRTIDGVERLGIRVRTERFSNGAQPIVDMEFRADRPGELRLTVTSAPGSAAMDSCVLTATMGNYGRLRLLWMRDGQVRSEQTWPGFTGKEFTGDAYFTSNRMSRMPDGDLVLCATSNEKDPHSVPPDPAGPGWAYRGSFPLTQYWRKPKDTSDLGALKVRVNGRSAYWATHNPIPGGLAFENFDLVQPFTENQVFVFGLTRRSPKDVARGSI